MPNCRPAGCAALFAACLASCCAIASDEVSSLDRALLADARDGSLDRFDLPAACLIASGMTDERALAAERRRLASACRTLAEPILAEHPSAHRAEQLHLRMHERLLTGKYSRGASDLRCTLATGDYNCLSALVIYNQLCREAGLSLTLWAQPGHVFCKLGQQRIEPTCNSWLVPAPEVGARPISPVELVGRFYYNRGIALLEQGQFEPGVDAMQFACRLDSKDTDARANLLAGLNNWALSLAEQDQPALAAALVARGLAIDPAFPPLVANQRYLLKP